MYVYAINDFHTYIILTVSWKTVRHNCVYEKRTVDIEGRPIT